MADSNRQRALAEVVTVEAWHKAFAQGRTRADLSVDVVFGVGRIGGGDPTGVRFRLALKRAQLVVVAPKFEPVRFDLVSVERSVPKDIAGKVVTREKLTRGADASLSLSGDASSKGAKAGLRGKVGAKLGGRRERTITTTQAFKGMDVTQNRTPEGDYRWMIEPSPNAPRLEGRPWNAEKVPRLELIDQRETGSKSMPPVVRVEVRCLREDLDISDIRLGDASAWSLIARRKNALNRRIAAEAAIRTLLTEEGLVVGDMADPFAELVLAMTPADGV